MSLLFASQLFSRFLASGCFKVFAPGLNVKLFSLRASRLGPCRLGGLVASRLRELNLDSLENEVCRFRVFEASLEIL